MRLPDLSERECQRQYTDVLELCGYEWYHPQLSIYSKRGWPDIAAVRPYDKLVLLELKKEHGQPSIDQCRWLEMLQTVERVETYLARPSDLDEIVETLRRRS